jgi:hypothetical protein
MIPLKPALMVGAVAAVFLLVAGQALLAVLLVASMAAVVGGILWISDDVD